MVFLKSLIFVLTTLFVFDGQIARADSEQKPLKAVFHVDESDRKIHNRALVNISNFFSEAESRGRTAFVKLVVNGGGVDMLLKSNQSMADRFSIMEVEYPNLEVVICNKSLSWREKVDGEALEVLDMANRAESGVYYIAELQMDGWAYIKP